VSFVDFYTAERAALHSCNKNCHPIRELTGQRRNAITILKCARCSTVRVTSLELRLAGLRIRLVFGLIQFSRRIMQTPYAP